MNNRTYESAVLMNAALEDEQIQSIISHIKDIVSKNDGELIDFEDWGRKRLAYMIGKNKIGYYAIFRFKAPPIVLTKLERMYKLDENILRHLTIKLTKGALEQLEKNKVQTAPNVTTVPETTAVEVKDEKIETKENDLN